MTPKLVIMSKAPEMGRVKTRLARDVGKSEALRFYRSQTRSLIRRLGHDPRWQTLIAVSPLAALYEEDFWPEEVPRVWQGEGDLGARMGLMMEGLPQGPIVIIGCDIPAIRPAHIAKAFKALGRHDAVFGPAEDGGYWLVGLKRFPNVRKIFSDVRWSTPHALEDTLANLKDARLAFLETLPDIDTGADLKRWRKEQRNI